MALFSNREDLKVIPFDEIVASDLNNLIDSLGSSFDEAEVSINLAEKWAENPEDVAVTVGKYSAFHWSEKANGWAETPEDTEVLVGQYSALHWASKAEASGIAAALSESNAATSEANALASKNAAATSETNALASENAADLSETNAATSESNALASENKAEDWAQEAEDIEVEPGLYSAFHWATKASATFAQTVFKDSDTGAANLPVGTIAQRPSVPSEGMFRRNSETGSFEGYDGSSWTGVGGASGGAGNPFIYENDQSVTQNYTIVATQNGMTAGPIEIANGVTVTVENGATWTIV